jgi:hypothetical protein
MKNLIRQVGEHRPNLDASRQFRYSTKSGHLQNQNRPVPRGEGGVGQGAGRLCMSIGRWFSSAACVATLARAFEPVREPVYPASGSNLAQGAGNRLGRQVFNARDPKRCPFRNRGDMRDRQGSRQQGGDGWRARSLGFPHLRNQFYRLLPPLLDEFHATSLSIRVFS